MTNETNNTNVPTNSLPPVTGKTSEHIDILSN